MNNLMKAEFFRIRRSGNLFIGIILLGVLSALIQFAGNEGLSING